ncbi:MAG: aminotransferase class V-fold PLP-dependent enzyme [Rhodothermales bacterium]
MSSAIMSSATIHTPIQAIEHRSFDIAKIRADFPALNQEVHGRPLVYLDNGATSQKPAFVIDRVQAYYANENSNIHRGVHFLSQQATDAYELARAKVRQFINAAHTHEVIYTRGTTEAINLVASSYGRKHLSAGDEVLISTMEHHSNIVPWQMICEETGAKLKVIPINERGEIIYDEFLALLNDRTRIVAICHVSNSLGTINPIQRMAKDAHENGSIIVVDGAQAAPHMPIDVQALDVDFYALSSHKMFGPTGVGILYGKEALLNAMPPYQGGGDMIDDVSFEKTTYNHLPYKFEAGTPNIAGGIALGSAIDYMMSIGFQAMQAHEDELLTYATDRLLSIEGLRIIGTAEHKAGVLSFLIGDIHPYDIGAILDQLGIAVRTGHHCTQPLMDHLEIPGTVRASLAFYNNQDDIDRLVEGLKKAKQMLS